MAQTSHYTHAVFLFLAIVLLPSALYSQDFKLITTPATDGNCNGAISVIIEGDEDLQYTYNWSSGESSANLEDKCAGSYEVEVYSDVDCIIILTGEILAVSCQDFAPSIVADVTNTCGSIPVGAINLNIDDADLYDFNWDNGNIGLSINSLDAGTYICRIRLKEIPSCFYDFTYIVELESAYCNVECLSVTIAVPSTGQIDLSISDLAIPSSINESKYTYTINPSSLNCDDLGVQEVIIKEYENGIERFSCSTNVVVTETLNNCYDLPICNNIILDVNVEGVVNIDPIDLIDNPNGDFDGLEFTISKDAFTCFDAGDNEVILTVSNNGEVVYTCSPIVTITNTNYSCLQNIDCIDTTVDLDNDGVSVLDIATLIDDQGLDLSGFSIAADPNQFTCNNIGSNDVQISVVDNSNNSEVYTCSIVVTVADPNNACGPAECPEPLHPDFTALMDFYNSTDGPNWSDNTGWADGATATDCDPCNGWKGVSCENGRVISLLFNGNNLNGPIPESISSLEFLKGITAIGEDISGNIPDGLFQIYTLESVVLLGSQLEGTLPTDYTGTPALEELVITNSNLSGTIPAELGGLAGLSFLNLSNNFLSGDLPTELGLLPQLELLVIENNDLVGCFPNTYINFCGLNSISFDGNIGLPFEGDFSRFCAGEGGSDTDGDGECDIIVPCPDPLHPDFTALMDFYDSTNGANWTNNTGWAEGAAGTNCDPCSWFGVECDEGRIYSIELSGNNLSGIITSSIGEVSNLQEIYLAENLITGELPHELGQLENLSLLNLENNLLEGCFPLTYDWFCDDVYVSFDGNIDLPFAGDFSRFCDGDGGFDIDGDGVCDSIDPFNCTDNIHPDIAALLSLYNSTDGPNWGNNEGWVDGASGVSCDPCGWYGVDCNVAGQVVEIHLGGNGMTGPLPSDLILPNLKHLILNKNPDIGGNLPDIFGGMPNLEGMEIQRCSFVGEVPPSIYFLSNLQYLSLSFNDFEGSISADIANLNSLTDLNLSSNNFEGNLPNEFYTLPVEYLDFSSNAFTGELHDFGSMENLNDLTLSDNDFSGCFPNSFIKFCNEDFQVYLEGNVNLPFDGDFSRFCNGEGGNDTDGDGVCDFIDPYNCTDNIHPDFAQLMSFYSSTGGVNWFEQEGWAEAAAGDNCDPCSWAGVECGLFQRVVRLDLYGNGLTGVIPADFGVPNLYELSLGGNQIGGDLPDVFLSMPNLHILGLSECLFTGPLPPSFYSLANLEQLDLSDSEFTGTLSSEIGNLQSLEELSFGGNNFEGNLPSEILSLSVEFIDLSSNAFTGDVLDFTVMNNLYGVILSDNNFSGCFPSSFIAFCDEENEFEIELEGNPNLPFAGDFSRFCAGEGGSDINGDGECDFPAEPMCPEPLHPDFQALMDFYNALDGPNWTDNTGWADGATATDCDPCNGWFGVECENGRVTELVLSSNRLSGPIPGSIGDLAELQILELPFGFISGELPTNLGLLTKLRKMDFSHQVITGAIPDLSNLQELEELIINVTYLNDPIPSSIGNLSALRKLELNSSDITGAIPTTIGDLSLLEKLDISDNSITGTLPNSLSLLNNLRFLDFTFNAIDGELPPGLGLIESLDTLRGAVTNLSGCFPNEYLNLCGGDIYFTNSSNLPFAGDFSRFCAGEGGGTDTDGDGNCDIPTTLLCVDTPHPDFQPLMDFYYATDGPNWIDNTGWVDGAAGTNCDPCSGWTGITCHNGRVLNLVFQSDNGLSGELPKTLSGLERLNNFQIQNNNIIGQIPDDFGNLVELFTLNLRNNSIAGVIPDTLGNLSFLGSLSLSGNNLTGQIPTSLNGMLNLRTLSLGSNNLSGNIPNLSSLTKLRTFSVRDNNIEGSIPSSIQSNVALTSLDVNGNLLSGTVPTEIGNLINLQNLNFGGNNITGAIPAEIGQLVALRTLIGNSNNLTGSLPEEIGQLLQLESLILSTNLLTGELPAEIGNMSALRQLILTQNQLSGNIPSSMNQLANITDVSLGQNQFSGSIPSGLNTLDGLTQFYVNDNSLSGCFPNELLSWCEGGINVNFSNNPNLPFAGDFSRFCAGEGGGEDLDGDGNCDIPAQLFCQDTPHPDYPALMDLYNSTDGPNWTDNTGWVDGAAGANCDPCSGWYGIFCESGRVTRLNSLNNGWAGSIPESIDGLTDLKLFSSILNNLSGTLPSSIGNLSNLEELKISNGTLSGTIPPEIGNLSNLKSLNLEANMLTGNIPPELDNLTNLELLVLSGNQLQGTIPDISSLTKLTELILSGNQLTGAIPEHIGNLSALNRLWLSNNGFSSNIPIALTQLSNLTNLSLGVNNLTGSIPSEFGGLSNLEFCYLSNNQLSGSLPVELGDIPDMDAFSADNNQLTGEIPKELAGWVLASRIWLFNNQLSGCIPNEFQIFCGTSTNISFVNNPNLPFGGSYAQFCAGEAAGTDTDGDGNCDPYDSVPEDFVETTTKTDNNKSSAPLVIVNEISNGAQTGEEFIELVIVGEGDCGTVDMTNIIIDDNQMDLDNVSSSNGFSPGHVRFANVDAWKQIKPGAIVVIYNPLVKNSSIAQADDPWDSNNDNVYILPINHELLSGNRTTPTITAPNEYDGTNPIAADWNMLWLYDKEDAIQVRSADGDILHSVSYSNKPKDLIGYSSIHKEAITGKKKVIAFQDGDVFSAENFDMIQALGKETPGLPNSAENDYFINNICQLNLAEQDAEPEILEYTIGAVRPNPFEDVLRFTIASPEDNEVEVRLYDLLGRIVEFEFIEISKGEQAIEFRPRTKLKNGVYNLAVYMDDQRISSQKVICQN